MATDGAALRNSGRQRRRLVYCEFGILPLCKSGKQLVWDVEMEQVSNPSNQTIWLEKDGEVQKIP